MNKGKDQRRFQYKIRRSKQVWIADNYFSIQKKWKKKNFKSEKNSLNE